jgi:prefoldin subunit 5
MKDDSKTEKQFVGELEAMRQRIAELEASEAEHRQVEEALRATLFSAITLMNLSRIPI